MKERFTTQERWDRGYATHEMAIASSVDPIRGWIERHFKGKGGACLEIGCFPGRYLAVFGELGYELHGIDLTPRVVNDLPAWLRTRGYRVGEFEKADALLHRFGRKYDVVCSFGFIEHFGDWRALVRCHAELVTPGGYLAITTPNFRGWCQRLAHVWLDRENLAEHNLEAMLPHEWGKVAKEHGCRVIECGYLGPFDFWVGDATRRNSLQTLAIRVIRKGIPIGRLFPDTVGAYAPYCVLVAQKGGKGS